jgi:hypothetical protein
MKRLVPIASLAVVAVLAGWVAWGNYTHVRREELLAIRTAITPGMSRENAVRVIKSHVRRTLFQDDDEGVPLLCVQEAGYLGAWILSISFNNGRAVAVHIGDYDDVYRAPAGAPPALIWGPEEQSRPPRLYQR